MRVGAAPAGHSVAGQPPAKIAQHVDRMRHAPPMLGLAAHQPVEAEHGGRRVRRLAGDRPEALGRQLGAEEGDVWAAAFVEPQDCRPQLLAGFVEETHRLSLVADRQRRHARRIDLPEQVAQGGAE